MGTCFSALIFVFAFARGVKRKLVIIKMQMPRLEGNFCPLAFNDLVSEFFFFTLLVCFKYFHEG